MTTSEQKITTIIKKSILPKLSLFKKLCLFFILRERFKKVSNSVLVNYKKKLLRIWIKQRSKLPNCIII